MGGGWGKEVGRRREGGGEEDRDPPFLQVRCSHLTANLPSPGVAAAWGERFSTLAQQACLADDLLPTLPLPFTIPTSISSEMMKDLFQRERDSGCPQHRASPNFTASSFGQPAIGSVNNIRRLFPKIKKKCCLRNLKKRRQIKKTRKGRFYWRGEKSKPYTPSFKNVSSLGTATSEARSHVTWYRLPAVK